MQNVRPSVQMVLRGVCCAAAVFGIDFGYFVVIHVNPTTVALTFLLAVLVVSTTWGLRLAVGTSLFAALNFNFFFLPPIGTLTIADSQNWVALFAFLFTAVLGSQLSEGVRRKAQEARERTHEMERLYELSQRLMVSGDVVALLGSLPRYVAASFGLTSVALYYREREEIYRSDPTTQGVLSEELKSVAAREEMLVDPARALSVVPLRMGVRTVGALGLSGDPLAPQTLDALAGLVAVAVERAAAVEALSHTEAARESERLRGALLDSVTHEFRTPLTAIKASVTSLRSNLDLDSSQRGDLLAVIEEEADRLNRLVGEAVEMAQLDARQVKLDRAPHDIRDAIAAALEGSKASVEARRVEVRIPEGLPKVLMDKAWITKVLQHLLENAAKYSATDSPVFVSSEVRGDRVVTSVADRGMGIDDLERAMIFDKFYRGQSQRYRVQGTGMGLAIVRAIVEAHEGRIGVTSQLGQGSVFSFDLPAASQPK
jgi:two-component system sensor histidine kinase KdpD